MPAQDYDLDPRFARLVPRQGLVERMPTTCPAGHRIGPGRMTVGGFTCQCTQDVSGTGGHRTWTCTNQAVLIHPTCSQRPIFSPWEGAGS